MKKITFLLLFIGILISPKVYSQCTSFSGGGPWTDFNGTFGGAPCDDGSGCPFNEISAFEIWADESYLMNEIQAGSTYTFSACNSAAGADTGGTAWDILFTVIAPSGAIDAFGLDAGSVCAITWTATESGTYEIGISEAGIPCDTSSNTSVDNGYPAITCTDGTAPCPTEVPDPVSNPTPADGATDVVVNPTDLSVPFSWDPATTGGTASTFDVYLGDSLFNLNLLGSTPATAVNITGMAYSTQYYWQIVARNGAGEAVGSSTWNFTTQACNETTAPVAAIGPTPADGATVNLSVDQNSLDFIWTEANPDDGYNLNIGTVNPPDNTISDVNSGVTLINLQTETTYYWSIESVNCFGATTSAVWSFTTGANLSTDDNELSINKIKLYPNPASDVFNIKTSLDYDSVEIYNLLGQSVIRLKKNQIIDNSINISSLVKGLYLVKVSAGDKTQTFNLVKE